MARKKREFHIVIEKDEDGYFVADVPALPGCHTQAKTLDQLMKRARQAIALWLEAKGINRQIDFVGVQRIAV